VGSERWLVVRESSRSTEITLAVPLISGRATGTTLFDRFVRLSLAARENRSRYDAILFCLLLGISLARHDLFHPPICVTARSAIMRAAAIAIISDRAMQDPRGERNGRATIRNGNRRRSRLALCISRLIAPANCNFGAHV